MDNQYLHTNNLRKFRMQQGLKQKEVAVLLGLKSEDRISHWEKGSAVPGIVNLFKLSMLFKVSPYELYPAIIECLSKDNFKCN